MLDVAGLQRAEVSIEGREDARCGSMGGVQTPGGGGAHTHSYGIPLGSGSAPAVARGIYSIIPTTPRGGDPLTLLDELADKHLAHAAECDEDAIVGGIAQQRSHKLRQQVGGSR